MGGNSSKSKGTNVYAELISGKSPPIKVLLNEQITSKAVDSLKDSKDVVNFFANNLVIEVLKDKSTPKKFGDFLKYTFSFESTLAPTRSLIYWSIMSDVSFQNLRLLTVSQISDWISMNAKHQILNSMNENMLSKNFKNVNIHPLIQWTLYQDNMVISPLSNIIIHSLPYTKVFL